MFGGRGLMSAWGLQSLFELNNSEPVFHALPHLSSIFVSFSPSLRSPPLHSSPSPRFHPYRYNRYYSTFASLGEHDVTAEESTEQHIRLAAVIRHSPYRSPLHSLAMVRLEEPARFNPYVQPIPLPKRCPQPGETCHVSGWGSTTPNQCEWI